MPRSGPGMWVSTAACVDDTTGALASPLKNMANISCHMLVQSAARAVVTASPMIDVKSSRRVPQRRRRKGVTGAAQTIAAKIAHGNCRVMCSGAPSAASIGTMATTITEKFVSARRLATKTVARNPSGIGRSSTRAGQACCNEVLDAMLIVYYR